MLAYALAYALFNCSLSADLTVVDDVQTIKTLDDIFRVKNAHVIMQKESPIVDFYKRSTDGIRRDVWEKVKGQDQTMTLVEVDPGIVSKHKQFLIEKNWVFYQYTDC